jgi:hypothetical protein
VVANATSPTVVALTWAPATDDVAVTSYAVLRNGTQVGTSTTPSYTDTGLAPSTAYSYTVVAKDAAGNASPASAAVGLTTPVPADTTPPAVTVTSPADKATGVAVGSSVTATFSEPVKNVSATTFTLRAATGATADLVATVAYDDATRIATLTPSAALTANTAYRVSLAGGATGIQDLAGNPLAPVSWTFTTLPAAAPVDTIPPTVTTTSPAANATGVAIGTSTARTPVTATFSEPVQGYSASTFTLRAAGATGNVAAAVTYDVATRIATLTPSAPLAANTRYTATVTGGTTAVRDAANNPLATVTWAFTTAAAADRTAPTVTTRSPGSGSTGVSRTGNITVTFSEAVTGVSSATFTLKNSSGSTITASVSRNGTSNQWILNPSPTLSSRVRYTVTVTGGTSGIKDAAGNPLTSASWTFTTGG